jgi:hypothetical protein
VLVFGVRVRRFVPFLNFPSLIPYLTGNHHLSALPKPLSPSSPTLMKNPGCSSICWKPNYPARSCMVSYYQLRSPCFGSTGAFSSRGHYSLGIVEVYKKITPSGCMRNLCGRRRSRKRTPTRTVTENVKPSTATTGNGTLPILLQKTTLSLGCTLPALANHAKKTNLPRTTGRTLSRNPPLPKIPYRP